MSKMNTKIENMVEAGCLDEQFPDVLKDQPG
jgi:hypothetical protein